MKEYSVQGIGTFSFIVIPDTQKLSRSHPEVFIRMTEWIAHHAAELQVKAVVHLGDVVDRGALEEFEYRNAQQALNIIEEAGIPLLIAPGNHDYDEPIVASRQPAPDVNRRSLSMFNRYFGVHRFEDKPWFGGVSERGLAENMYARIDAGNTSFLFLILEFGPREQVLKWADDVIRNHNGHKVVVITHCHLFIHGGRTKPGDDANPKHYAMLEDSNDGEDIWQKLLQQHANVIAVFSGHHIPVNVSHRMDCGIHGNQVVQLFQNWQNEEYGGSGRFRIVDFDAADGTMNVWVYNPLIEAFELAPGYELRFERLT